MKEITLIIEQGEYYHKVKINNDCQAFIIDLDNQTVEEIEGGFAYADGNGKIIYE